MRLLLLSLALSLVFVAFSEEYKLVIKAENLPVKTVYLQDFYGDKNTTIDSTVSDTTGTFSFSFSESNPVGMYRVMIDKSLFFDIIYNKENIRIETDINDLYESLEVVESVENQLFYDFLKAMHNYRNKFDLLAPLNDYYPRTDSFFHTARAQYIGVQAEIRLFVNDAIEQYPNAWVTKIIKRRKPLFYDPSMDEFQRRAYQKEHYFDEFTFDDVELIKSNIYTTTAINYMSLYSNRNLTQDQLQDEFIKAVDKIMYTAMDNPLVYEFVVEYLVGGFEQYHFDKVLDYIAENYTPDQCENNERKSDLQTRLSKYAELAVGKPAPDFNLPDDKGKLINLNDIKANYTLVVFWASWCPHCTQMLPELKNLYNSSLTQKDIQIITVSLDQVNEEWVAALEVGEYPWVNTCDLKGWDSPAAVNYNVYATPTMFLLDKKKNIVAKPITMAELTRALMDEKLLQ